MKTILASLLAAAFVLTASPSMAANLCHIGKLIQTGKCPKCDLRGAILRGAKLRDAKLNGAKFCNTILQYNNARRQSQKRPLQEVAPGPKSPSALPSARYRLLSRAPY